MKNKIYGFIRIDNMIDIITNSSSELFIIENTMTLPILVEMVNSALEGFSSVTENSVETRVTKTSEQNDWEIENALEQFPEEDRDMLREKYFTDPKYYAVSFDRDQICSSDIDVRGKLSEIGFELIDTDY